MKLKQIKCPNCNASIKLKDDKKEDIECEFCGSTFTYVPGKEEVELKKAEAERAKHSAEEYKAKKEYEETKKINDVMNPAFNKIFILVFAVIAIGGIALFFIISSSMNNATKQENDDYDKNYFNSTFEMVTKISNGFFVKQSLNDIINSNNKNKDHIIKVTYNDISTSKTEEIESIIDELDEMKEYRINLNYDDAGYINEFIISEK